MQKNKGNEIKYICLLCKLQQSLNLEDGRGGVSGVENPICDDEMIRPERTSVQHAAPNGRHDNEDNGWVVPLDQVQDKRDVEDTKL